MIEDVFQRSPLHGDAGVSHVGEVRQPHPPGFLSLTKDDLLLSPMGGRQSRIGRSIVR